MTFLRTHGLNSALQFEAIDTPKQGMVKILNSSGGNTELLNLAQDQSAADAWLASNRYQSAWCEVVGDGNRSNRPGDVRSSRRTSL